MTRDMQDNLEKFIKKHRDEFDDLTPSDSLWKGINKELSQEHKNSNQIFFWKVAAIILFTFSLGLTLFINKNMLQTEEQVAVYDDEFMETENYYTSVINTRQQLIRAVAQTYPDIESDFESDWKKLDEGYKNLKLEYEKNKNEEIRSALVQNLRARLNLLNKQIEVLEQIEKQDVKILEI